MFEDSTLLQPLTQVVFLVGVGFAARLLGVISETGIQQLTGLILKITLPVLLFMSAARIDMGSLVQQGPLVAAAGIGLPLIGYVAGAGLSALLRLEPAQASVVRISASMGNTAFVGIPVCTALWGAEGALLAAIYDQVLIVPFLTLVPLEYGKASGRANWRAILLAPMLWGLVLGIAWRSAGLGVPSLLATPLGVLGDVTFPMSLLLVGALSVPQKLDRRLALPLAAFVVGRLVLAPAAALVVVHLLQLHGTGAGVMVIQAAMPASVTLTVMARQYRVDANLAATGALLSFPLAALTLPVVAMWAGG